MLGAVDEAREILNSRKFRRFVHRAKAGESDLIVIRGRTITADPLNSYPFYAMTDFPRRGFTLGPDAFSSTNVMFSCLRPPFGFGLSALIPPWS